MLEWVREAFGDRFELKRELGRGGMGVVYLAYDTQLDCDRAIKVLLPELATAEMAERFVREAKIMAKIKHPNVVPIHDAGQKSGLFYYVMDYVEGPTLLDRLSVGSVALHRGGTCPRMSNECSWLGLPWRADRLQH